MLLNGAMADFKFLRNPATGKAVISAPRRAKRMDVSKKAEGVCPFCIGREGEEEELYRVTSTTSTTSITSTTGKEREDIEEARGTPGTRDTHWLVRVIPNKFPFTPHHEIVVLSPDHHKGFDELPFSHLELVLNIYRERYNENSKNGQVYIFHNGGLGSGESIPHPHTQIAVVPAEVKLDIPPLNVPFSRFHIPFISNKVISKFNGKRQMDNGKLETDYFNIFCPSTSEWPDEVWVAPKRGGQVFGSINDEEISDLAFVISRLIQIFDLRHGHEFPFNFYIYPGRNWYFRLIPRMKVLGGFEVGTGVMINTENPEKTLEFIKEHFWKPNIEKIKTQHQADYIKTA